MGEARVDSGSAEYPYNSLADAHGAAVHEGDTPDATYGRFGTLTPAPAPPLP
jgi:hypothetical protein